MDLARAHALSPDDRKQRLVELSRGIAHPMRLEIVRMLLNKPREDRCICGDIVNALPLAQSSVSQHLRVLKETGWIQGEIDGSRVCYCTVDGILEFYLDLLRQSFKPIPVGLRENHRPGPHPGALDPSGPVSEREENTA